MAIDNRDWYRDWWRKRTDYEERARFRMGADELDRLSKPADRVPRKIYWIGFLIGVFVGLAVIRLIRFLF